MNDYENMTLQEKINYLEGQSQADFAEYSKLCAKVDELLECKDGTLRATGKCNDLLCELIGMRKPWKRS